MGRGKPCQVKTRLDEKPLELNTAGSILHPVDGEVSVKSHGAHLRVNNSTPPTSTCNGLCTPLQKPPVYKSAVEKLQINKQMQVVRPGLETASLGEGIGARGKSRPNQLRHKCLG